MPRILLVEDEPAIADTLLYALGTECFEVTHTLTGTDALAAAEVNHFDFAILDIGLPDMTGLDVCRRLRDAAELHGGSITLCPADGGGTVARLTIPLGK